jgi:hypothetical protein
LKPIKIYHPLKLDESMIQAEWLPFESQCDLKPSMVALDDGRMMLCTMNPDKTRGADYPTRLTLYRSSDSGRSWDKGEDLGYRNTEPNLDTFDDRIVLMAYPAVVNGAMPAITYLRYDMQTGEKTVVHIGVDDLPEKFRRDFKGFYQGSYNILKRREDGALICIMSDGKNEFLAESYNLGLGWSVKEIVHTDLRIRYYNAHPLYPGCSLFCEALLFHSPSGRLMAFARIEPSGFGDYAIPQFPDRKNCPHFDNYDALVWLESPDGGLSWELLRGFGCTGMMYPSVAVLSGCEMLVTYTLRAIPPEDENYPYPHMGLQGIVVTENADGSFECDFDHDLIILDDSTPDFATSGAPYGRIMQLSDGSFISPFSYTYYTDELLQWLNEKQYWDRSIYEAMRARVAPLVPGYGDESRFTYERTPKTEFYLRHHFTDYMCASLGMMKYLVAIRKWRLDRK